MPRWHHKLAVALLLAAIVGCGTSSGGHAAANSSPGLPGDHAAAFVQGSTFTSLEVDVYWAKGAEPDPAALAFFQRRLVQHVQKPAGVTVALAREIDVPETSVWSAAACQQVDAQVGAASESGARATMHVIYLGGKSARDELGERTLGMGITGSSFMVFKSTILASPQGSGTPTDLEGAVLVHEAGHLCGLVGLGAPLTSVHQDPYSSGHCLTPGCLMQSTSGWWTIANGTADYCSACVADLQALGGR
jgi:hypothetical protein